MHLSMAGRDSCRMAAAPAAGQNSCPAAGLRPPMDPAPPASNRPVHKETAQERPTVGRTMIGDRHDEYAALQDLYDGGLLPRS